MNAPTPVAGITREEAQKLIAETMSPLREAIEALIQKALANHAQGDIAAPKQISLKELSSKHTLCRPETLDGNCVVVLSKQPIESPNGINRYKVLVTPLTGDALPTLDNVPPFDLIIFREDFQDITKSQLATPSAAVEAELYRQLIAMGVKSQTFFHMAILILSTDPVAPSDMPTLEA